MHRRQIFVDVSDQLPCTAVHTKDTREENEMGKKKEKKKKSEEEESNGRLNQGNLIVLGCKLKEKNPCSILVQLSDWPSSSGDELASRSRAPTSTALPLQHSPTLNTACKEK